MKNTYDPRFNQDRFPNPGEICALAQIGCYKRASLLFDKIYVSPQGYQKTPNIPPELTFGDSFQFLEDSKGMLCMYNDHAGKFHEVEFNGYDDVSSVSSQAGKCLYLAVALQIFQNRFIGNDNSFVFVYPNEWSFERSICDGKNTAYQAAFNNLQIVTENDLSWEQIVEFRKDKEATRKYRDLRLWLADSLKCESVSQATDLISQRIDDYEWAIKKHGFKTISGFISYLIDNKSFLTLLTGASAAGFFAGTLWGAITAGLFISAELCVWISERLIELEDLRRGPGSEIAIFYDIKKSFKNK